MALSRRGRNRSGELNAWPGYVDALSTLLMVIIFVLLVFVLAQGFLSVTLSSRDRALDRLNRQVSELSEMLSLQRSAADDLRANLARAADELRAATAARDALTQQLQVASAARDAAQTALDSAKSDRDQMAARLSDMQATSQGMAARLSSLEGQLTDALSRADSAGGDAARTFGRIADAQRARQAAEARVTDLTQQLATANGAAATARQELAALQQQAAQTAAQLADAQKQLQALKDAQAAADKQVLVDKQTMQAKLSDIASLNAQVQALTALRDQLEKQVQDADARANGADQARQQAADATKLGESARAQVALLTQQLQQLHQQLAQITQALDASEKASKDKDTQIAALGQRLNTALAARVEQLQQYRSDFFGRLRQILGDRPDVRIVGDRFVFQSEVLFPPGSADLSTLGQQQIRELATTLKQVIPRIPANIPWILRVDGHADRTPIHNARFANNWELSAARAMAVAHLLMDAGIPANRIAATAFGDTQPIDQGDSPDALARNRRIEFRLTDR